MADIKSLREQQARIATEARAKFNEIKDDTPEDRAAEIEREFDAMMADHDKLRAQEERLAKLEAVERSLNDADPRRPMGSGEARGVQEVSGPTYEEAFDAYLRAQGNIGVLGAEVRSVLSGGLQSVENRAQTTTDAAGGYTVPQGMASTIIQTMAMWGPMYNPGITTEMVTDGGGRITIPTNDDTSAVVVKHTEGTTLTDDGGSDTTFGEKYLDAYAFNTEWLRVSKELADDSAFGIQQFLAELLGKRLGRRANTELTTGDGTGDPNGIVTACAKGVDATVADAIAMDELIDLIHSVDPAYRGSPRVGWMLNDLTKASIRKLKDGEGRYLWEDSVKIGEPDMLLGYPVHINQAMANISTGTKPVIFGDFGAYWVRKVGSPLIGAIQDKDFWPGFGIAGYIRFDGELTDTGAVKHILMA